MSAMADLYNDMEAAQALMGEGNKMNDFQADRLLKVAGNISESLATIANCLEVIMCDSLSQKNKFAAAALTGVLSGDYWSGSLDEIVKLSQELAGHMEANSDG